jgi:hypothetical protein
VILFGASILPGCSGIANLIVTGRYSFPEIFSSSLEAGTSSLLPPELVVSQFKDLFMFGDFDLHVPTSPFADRRDGQAPPSNFETAIPQ